jgi:pectate lyase
VEKLTGGGNGPVIEVRTAAEFLAAAERRSSDPKSHRESAPAVIRVMADIDLGELANERPGNDLKNVGRVQMGSNTTIYAPGAGAAIRHGILEMHGTHNAIIHHNWFENIDDRAPRVRTGNVHIFNDFVDGAANATISVMKAVTLVENSVYQYTAIATTFSHAGDSLAKNRAGTIVIVNCQNINPRHSGEKQKENERFEVENNFAGNVKRDQLRFNPPVDWSWKTPGSLPYAYTPDPLEIVPSLVRRYAGVGRVAAGL